jgi:hypothetical protein
MKRIFFLFASLVASAAFAQSASSTAGSVSGAQSTAVTASQATGGNSAAMGGNATADAINGAAAAQNSQNITFNSPSQVTTNANTNVSGTTELRTVATVYAPPVGMTANCMIGTSGGATGLGWGFALGTGIEDKGCSRRENARMLHGLGKTVAAVKLMCNDPESAAALGPVDCPPPEPKPAQ